MYICAECGEESEFLEGAYEMYGAERKLCELCHDEVLEDADYQKEMESRDEDDENEHDYDSDGDDEE